MSDLSLLKTPLYEEHKALGARIVDFGGWALPVNYSSQVEEHHAVRNDVGMFDVSHMTVSDITGADVLPFLSNLLANDINKITSSAGKALYSCMLNEKGGVIDDLIVYYLNDTHCRMVTNAATNAKDMAWLQKQAQTFNDVIVTEKPELALIAVQGPNAISKLQDIFSGEIADLINGLKRFQGGFDTENSLTDGGIFIGRTGYTGEDGVEMIIPASQASSLWNQLVKAGVQPCGLGARDTLRLEAGMALYGSDLDEEHTPLDSGLSWAVAIKDDRDFIGRQALKTPPDYKMIGLILEGKGVLRGHQSVLQNGEVIGEVTSGTFSPTLGESIALARVKNGFDTNIDSLLQVEIRQKHIDARIVKYPFVKK
ncbi:MAG: glycine cleavage system aminomethyltransferase GcvT [Cellvibrionaceae bacterium]